MAILLSNGVEWEMMTHIVLVFNLSGIFMILLMHPSYPLTDISNSMMLKPAYHRKGILNPRMWLLRASASGHIGLTNPCLPGKHTMDLLWEKFQWILPLYMKPISFQSKASVVCSVTAAIFIDFWMKKLDVFPQNKSPGIEMLINFLC